MASLLSLHSLLSIFLFFSITSAKLHPPEYSIPISDIPFSSPSPVPAEIQNACKASRDPPKCEAALADPNHSPRDLTASQIILSALSVASHNLTSAQSMLKGLLYAGAGAGDTNVTTAATNCLEGLGYSEFRFGQTADALPRGDIKDARAWMSAGLGYQIGCLASLQKLNQTIQVSTTSSLMDSLIGFSTNALWMMVNYDIHGNETGSWAPPETERDGSWEIATGSGCGFTGGVPSGLTPNVTVCKSGGCDYETVQAAVNATPDYLVSRRFVIWIKAGLYDEIIRVPLPKRNVVFLGDGMGKTVITGSLSVGLMSNVGMSTYESATIGVVGDGFMASNLTVQNTAGIGAGQAVAFRSDSDLSVIENCEFLGNQDTFYAHSLRQYYKSCRIQGNVDFIFGNAAAFFQDCVIIIVPRLLNPEKGETNAVTAHSRLDPGQSTGFVFQNCLINGTEEYMTLYHSKPKVHKNFLGRPWKEYSRTVFIQCNLESLVHPEGWMPWNGEFALKTLYYGEFNNSGAGSNTSGRVLWSSQIPAEHVSYYSVQSFIQGDKWIPPSS